MQWSEVTCMSFEDTVKVKNICHIDGTGYTIRYYKHSYTSIETGLLNSSSNRVAGGVAMLDLAMYMYTYHIVPEVKTCCCLYSGVLVVRYYCTVSIDTVPEEVHCTCTCMHELWLHLYQQCYMIILVQHCTCTKCTCICTCWATYTCMSN